MLKYNDKKTKNMPVKVPQDVQREDTIIGPLTLKQLFILMFGGGIAYAIYISLSRLYFIEIWLPPVAIVSAITLAFAFLKVHNLPFHLFLMYLIEYLILPKKRVWIKGSDTPAKQKMAETVKKTKAPVVEVKEKKERSLKELTEILDTRGGMDETQNKK
ncbi:hypothetical protein GF354_03490 [Candidatus Peregrinibacteria bacterium]|nr:hypothetical protein [Candidatus Peregrinibacteria bacterium]